MRRLNFKTPTGLLEYTITRRSRVTKRLHMELDEDGGLVVVAPRHWSSSHINTTLSQNISRVERFLVRARKRQLEPLHYVHGEMHFYLGQQHPLAVHPSPGAQTSVAFAGKEICVELRQNNSVAIRAAIHGWYYQQALKVLGERFQLIAGRATWASDENIPMKLRRMKRTWGNCSSSGVIKLNTHLIKAPLPVIDSVIAHELCHLQEMNHGKAFYALLECLNPNWREDRLRLRSEGNLYLL
jgi:predicted metal-dependent hydrolase